METGGMVDTSSDAALKSLADIALPPPISYMPQTWGWAALAILLLLAAAALLWISLRRRQANRYRREALAELDALVGRGAGEAGDFQQKLAEILKRTALAAWPREAVASLSGAGWAQFLAGHGPSKDASEPLAALVNDREYAARPMRPDEQAALVAAVRLWIERHHVSA